ncbi:hypothetical protein [Streptomyces curacoi]|nr:hypothetical protein [Streptomyces curacoi]
METRREFVHAGPGRLALAASHLHLYLSLSLFPAAFPAVHRHAEAA